jgi:hypothetical protein
MHTVVTVAPKNCLQVVAQFTAFGVANAKRNAILDAKKRVYQL